MDRADLSRAIIAEMAVVVEETLTATLPGLLGTDDLGALERQVQQVSRQVWGRLVEMVLAQRVREEPRPDQCPACGRGLRQRVRSRHLQGLVGDYTVERPTYWCAACRQSVTPCDVQWGLGPGHLSPALARVVARAALEAPFAQAVETVAEASGVWVDAEAARRTTERLGAVAEAQTQAAVARARQGAEPWTAAETAVPPNTPVLAVEVDGVHVHRAGAWHEMKVVTMAPLGPDLRVERETGRTHLVWGPASYGAGVEEAEDFWWRVYVEARRRGLGTPAVRTVVVLGDGAAWIWQRAAHFLAGPGVEVVEIVDIYHAYDYLWSVGDARWGAGTPQAAAWVEPLKDRLYTHGAPAVLDALAALAALLPTTPQEAEAIATAQHYFASHAARMDYPRFVAQQFPIGSGAVESSCKCLVEARAKEAGMRWSTAGVQRVATLRALHRSGRWAAFWQGQPHAANALRPPRRPRVPVQDHPVRVPPPPRVVSAPVVPVHPAPHPTPAPHQRPLILPRSA